ncbi:hypothetical protein GPECTOR_2g1113 [Gonium pectorale]|uniref:BRCT domain-containing protein n=1 Tax=Gonium pectorale TaxID=33097 RepID=A0A150H0K6_GONPE|nr:hypothetical protein GPECTOR_2g1113 [Gonium pectorale]|eukprot:KXZ55564.1 hypothetical protein GPECTOR_2g1113 [Gonium pectorale]
MDTAPDAPAAKGARVSKVTRPAKPAATAAGKVVSKQGNGSKTIAAAFAAAPGNSRLLTASGVLRSGALPTGSVGTGQPAASAATVSTGAPGPTLGQYPRGKDHPLRAGVKYLAHTCIDAAVASTIHSAVRQLGNARLCTPGYEDGHITHLVVGEQQRRTIKVLLGIANGALLVTPAWVTESLAAGCWLPEEDYMAPGLFADTAAAVRVQLQAAQQQATVAAPAGAPAAAPSSPRAGVSARPLAGRLVSVHNTQCNGLKLADLQARKADVEKLVVQ